MNVLCFKHNTNDFFHWFHIQGNRKDCGNEMSNNETTSKETELKAVVGHKDEFQTILRKKKTAKTLGAAIVTHQLWLLW